MPARSQEAAGHRICSSSIPRAALGWRQTPRTRGKKKFLLQAWAASAPPTGGKAPPPALRDFSAMFNEFTATQRAAFAGDAQAMARLRAAAQAVAALDPALAARIPDPADLVAARQGDGAAIARLKAFHARSLPNRRLSRSLRSRALRKSSDISSVSFVPFHPSLKRRLKRLDRMGAHVALAAPRPKMGMVVFVLSLIFAPLLLLLIALFLLLIAIMTMASLAFLVVWLAVIHKIFRVCGAHLRRSAGFIRRGVCECRRK